MRKRPQFDSYNGTRAFHRGEQERQRAAQRLVQAKAESMGYGYQPDTETLFYLDTGEDVDKIQNQRIYRKILGEAFEMDSLYSESVEELQF